MPDVIQIVDVLVVSRMIAVIVLKLVRKCLFHGDIRALSRENIRFFCRIGADHQRMHHRLCQRHTGRKAAEHKQEHQPQRDKREQSGRFSQDAGSFPSGLCRLCARSIRRMHLSCCSRLIVAPPDRAFLIPAGHGIAAGLGRISLFSGRCRFCIGLHQPLFGLSRLAMLSCLCAAVNLLTHLNSGFAGFFKLMRRLHTGVIILFFADSLMNLR